MRLLYVEDNRINALLFEEGLRTEPGFELRVAEDGMQALQCAREWPPEVLVLDSHLPDTTGLELLAELRTLPGLAHIPVFMCSADAQPEDIERAFAVGLAGYWTKPIDFETVFADLRRIKSSTS